MDLSQKLKHRKILVLSGSTAHKGELLELLKQISEITIVDDVEQALERLNKEDFDAVVSQTSDFLPLERASVNHQAIEILNTIGEGVCIVADDGTITWANRQMELFGTRVKEGVSQHAKKAGEFFRKRLEQEGISSQDQLRPRRYSITDEKSNRYFELIATAMLDLQGKLLNIAMVVWEATSSRRQQQRIDAIDKAGRELVRLEADAIAGMTVEQRISLVQDKIVRYARDLLHFDHFVVRLLDVKSNKLEVLFGVGMPEDEEIEVFANSQGNGITGYVAATGRSYVCNNLSNDPHYLPSLHDARCSLTVPLRLHDKVIGTLNVESHKENLFNEDDRQVAEIFARYIAFSLNILDLLVVERYKTTGQAADNLTSQMTEPLSKIITEASLLMEEYIGHDDLRYRLQSIIESTTTIKKALKDAQQAPKGIIGVHSDSAKGTTFPELREKHILVVDDEQFIRQTIADVVQKCGCLTDTARDGREALALIGQCKYDLVISDIKLPHASGYEIFACAQQKNIPVVLMTGFGYDPEHSIVRANREGLSAVLYKPFKADHLLETIRKAVSDSDENGHKVL